MAAVIVDGGGNVFFFENRNHRVASSLANGTVVTWVGGNNNNYQSLFNYPNDVKVVGLARGPSFSAASGGDVYVSNQQGANGGASLYD